MEKEGKLLYTKAEGQKVYSTEPESTPEEKKKLLEEKQEYDQAYSLWLLGKGPKPGEKTGDNLVELPVKKPWKEDKAA